VPVPGGLFICGTVDWQRFAIVLNVPKESKHIAYGVLLLGTGQTWADEVWFDVVSEKIPITNLSEKGKVANRSI